MPKIRSAVKQPEAENYLLVSLIAFALTVIATRLFLQAAGYPQVGNSVLHIAHAIWGGLLLFAAVLVALVLANRWAFTLSAVLSGVGVGLFIDEVGKFITQQNDYFFPPAAPLIYSLFLLTVLVLLVVRRRRQPSPRASLYRVLFGLREVLDGDLDPLEQQRLLEELENGRRSLEPHLVLLSEQLSAYLQQDTLPLARYRPGLWTRFTRRMQALGARVGRKTHRRLIEFILAILGLSALLTVFALILVWLSPQLSYLDVFESVLTDAEKLSTQNPVWLVVRLVLQTVVGLLYLWALVDFWRKRELAGVDMAIFAALLSLTAVQLLSFYLNQFGAIAGALAAFGLLLLLLAYRAWYVQEHAEAE
jgi:hypothetical protein